MVVADAPVQPAGQTTSTISDALAELKVIDGRIAKKREFIQQNLLRASNMVDPLANQGGSPRVIAQELQSIHDLEERKVRIRRAIQNVNVTVEITIGTTTRTIADWLAWRRDVAETSTSRTASRLGKRDWLRALATLIDRQKQATINRGHNTIAAPDNQKQGDITVHVNEQELSLLIEDTEAILATLDGRLSQRNATTDINY